MYQHHRESLEFVVYYGGYKKSCMTASTFCVGNGGVGNGGSLAY